VLPQKRCKRISVEVWTPGSHAKPDGPSRDMEGRCVLPLGHEEYGQKHIYGDWLERERG